MDNARNDGKRVDELTGGRRRLHQWYRRWARPLPWGNTCDPYAIWISEVMLQQTQVNTVVPCSLRWMTAFPTVRVLAKAKEDQLLLRWEGLGY